jgi:hexosaminidase
LKTLDEVQSYFVKRVANIITSKGKKMIGWDEILEGGLAPDATVMSWRGMKGGIAAAKENHKVVMSPSDFVYMDLMQGDKIIEPNVYSSVRLSKTYKFDPVPEGINPDLILGGQGNLWTEQIPHMRAAQYMLWPRGLALAESVWSPAKNKNYNYFINKVEHEFKRLDVKKIKYARTMYEPIFSVSWQKDNLKVKLETEVEGLDIYYSFDETHPDEFYPKYTNVLTVPKDALTLKVVTYRDGKPIGRQINMPYAELEKRAGKK